MDCSKSPKATAVVVLRKGEGLDVWIVIAHLELHSTRGCAQGEDETVRLAAGWIVGSSQP